MQSIWMEGTLRLDVSQVKPPSYVLRIWLLGPPFSSNARDPSVVRVVERDSVGVVARVERVRQVHPGGSLVDCLEQAAPMTHDDRRGRVGNRDTRECRIAEKRRWIKQERRPLCAGVPGGLHVTVVSDEDH